MENDSEFPTINDLDVPSKYNNYLNLDLPTVDEVITKNNI